MRYIEELKALKYTERFILPLVGVSWFSIENWLKEAWLTNDKRQVVVETTVKIQFIRTGRYFTADGRHFTLISIPQTFFPDVDLFIAGKYSQFSDNAKKMITEHSGLIFNLSDPRQPGNIIHHAALVALHTTPEMLPFRYILRNALSVELFGEEGMIDEDAELLSPPGVREQVFYQGWLP